MIQTDELERALAALVPDGSSYEEIRLHVLLSLVLRPLALGGVLILGLRQWVPRVEEWHRQALQLQSQIRSLSLSTSTTEARTPLRLPPNQWLDTRSVAKTAVESKPYLSLSEAMRAWEVLDSTLSTEGAAMLAANARHANALDAFASFVRRGVAIEHLPPRFRGLLLDEFQKTSNAPTSRATALLVSALSSAFSSWTPTMRSTPPLAAYAVESKTYETAYEPFTLGLDAVVSVENAGGLHEVALRPSSVVIEGRALAVEPPADRRWLSIACEDGATSKAALIGDLTVLGFSTPTGWPHGLVRADGSTALWAGRSARLVYEGDRSLLTTTLARNVASVEGVYRVASAFRIGVGDWLELDPPLSYFTPLTIPLTTWRVHPLPFVGVEALPPLGVFPSYAAAVEDTFFLDTGPESYIPLRPSIRATGSFAVNVFAQGERVWDTPTQTKTAIVALVDGTDVYLLPSENPPDLSTTWTGQRTGAVYTPVTIAAPTLADNRMRGQPALSPLLAAADVDGRVRLQGNVDRSGTVVDWSDGLGGSGFVIDWVSGWTFHELALAVGETITIDGQSVQIVDIESPTRLEVDTADDRSGVDLVASARSWVALRPLDTYAVRSIDGRGLEVGSTANASLGWTASRVVASPRYAESVLHELRSLPLRSEVIPRTKTVQGSWTALSATVASTAITADDLGSLCTFPTDPSHVTRIVSVSPLVSFAVADPPPLGLPLGLSSAPLVLTRSKIRMTWTPTTTVGALRSVKTSDFLLWGDEDTHTALGLPRDRRDGPTSSVLLAYRGSERWSPRSVTSVREVWTSTQSIHRVTSLQQDTWTVAPSVRTEEVALLKRQSASWPAIHRAAVLSVAGTPLEVSAVREAFRALSAQPERASHRAVLASAMERLVASLSRWLDVLRVGDVADADMEGAATLLDALRRSPSPDSAALFLLGYIPQWYDTPSFAAHLDAQMRLIATRLASSSVEDALLHQETPRFSTPPDTDEPNRD